MYRVAQAGMNQLPGIRPPTTLHLPSAEQMSESVGRALSQFRHRELSYSYHHINWDLDLASSKQDGTVNQSIK